MSLLSDQVEKPFENLCLGPCWGPPPIPPAPPPSLARARPAPPPAGFQGRLTLCGHGHSAARSCGAHGVERAGRRVWAGSCREVVWGARLGVREVGTGPRKLRGEEKGREPEGGRGRLGCGRLPGGGGQEPGLGGRGDASGRELRGTSCGGRLGPGLQTPWGAARGPGQFAGVLREQRGLRTG